MASNRRHHKDDVPSHDPNTQNNNPDDEGPYLLTYILKGVTSTANINSFSRYMGWSRPFAI